MYTTYYICRVCLCDQILSVVELSVTCLSVPYGSERKQLEETGCTPVLGKIFGFACWISHFLCGGRSQTDSRISFGQTGSLNKKPRLLLCQWLRQEMQRTVSPAVWSRVRRRRPKECGHMDSLLRRNSWTPKHGDQDAALWVFAAAGGASLRYRTDVGW